MELRCPACHSMLHLEQKVDLEIIRIATPSSGTPHGRRGFRTESPNRQAVEVVCRVAAEHGFALSDLRGPSRQGPIADARRLAARAAYAETDVSLPKLGRILDRGHSTVLSLIRTAEKAETA